MRRRRATAIGAGQRGAIKNIKTETDTRYYPVIVTYEPLPSHPLALRLYESIIHKGGRLQGAMIKPVTLLNTRDIEAIEGILLDGTAWLDFLTRKHTARYVDDSFHNYVYRVFAGTQAAQRIPPLSLGSNHGHDRRPIVRRTDRR
jgi:hypothetical protein